MGTLLLWRQAVPEARVQYGSFRFSVPQSEDGFMVVDGQQRVTSLIAALAPEARGLDERFEVFFDLTRRKFVGPHRGVAPARSIPVREVLESRTFLAWLREYGDDFEDEDLEVADQLGGALRDYKLPAYVVEGNDEGLLREVFDRVNSAGKPITRAQVFHALFARDSQPGSLGAISEELSHLGFGLLPENRIVQSLLSIRGGDVQRDLHDEFAPHEDVDDWYDKTTQALSTAIRFLQSEGVAHQSLLPTSFPIPVLAAFFHLHPDPDPWLVKLLSRWLWRGWVHGFGREAGQTPTLRRAVRNVNPRKGEPDQAPDAFEAVRRLLEPIKDAPIAELTLDAFRSDNANSRLALLALASLRPLTPSAEQLDLSEALESRGAEAIGDLVPYRRGALGSRGFWLTEWGRLQSDLPNTVLRSHGVESSAASSLEQGDVAGFVEKRSVHILTLTLNLLNSRMMPNAHTRPPLSDLFVPDEEIPLGLD